MCILLWDKTQSVTLGVAWQQKQHDMDKESATGRILQVKIMVMKMMGPECYRERVSKHLKPPEGLSRSYNPSHLVHVCIDVTKQRGGQVAPCDSLPKGNCGNGSGYLFMQQADIKPYNTL